MSILPDTAWLNALEKITTTTAAILALFGTACLIASTYGWFYLDAAPSAAKALFASVALLGCAVLIVHFFRAMVHQYRWRAVTAKRRATVLSRLDTLDAEAWAVLTELVSTNQQTFAARVVEPALGTLVSTGIVVRGAGTHHALGWPYAIPNFVWEELKRRISENQCDSR